MKRICSFILAIAMVVMLAVCPAYAVDSYPDNLTDLEKGYLRQRGHSPSDVLGYSDELLAELLAPLKYSIAVYAAPSDYATVTDIPTQGTEYFHPNTGMVDGTFADQIDYARILSTPKSFSQYVFGRNSAVPQSKYLYYLWGEWDDTAKTHQGVDVRNESDPTCNIKSQHAGTVVYSGGTYGAVGIYDGKNTHYYLHMTDRIAKDKTVSYGDVIGKQGSVGLSSSENYHLHYECHSGKSTTGPKGTGGLYTMKPYYVMISSTRQLDLDGR